MPKKVGGLASRLVGGSSPARPKRVLVVGEDPYVAFLIRLYDPSIEATEADHLTPEILAEERPDLVVVSGSDLWTLETMLKLAPRPKVVAVSDPEAGSLGSPPPGVDRVVLRPIIPADLQEAVAAELGIGRRPPAARPRGPALDRVRRAISLARLGAIAVAAVITAGEVPRPHSSAILASVIGYGVLRALLPKGRPLWVITDLVASIAVLSQTGGLNSEYTLFAIVNAAAAGIWFGPVIGGVAGLAVAVGTVPMALDEFRAAPGSSTGTWMALLPLMGLTAGYALRFWEGADPRSGLAVEANRVLTSLYRIARAMPGGLDVGSVADATVQELAEEVRAPAGAILLGAGALFDVISSYGLEDDRIHVRLGEGALAEPLESGSARVVTTEELGPEHARSLAGRECWIAAGIRHQGAPLGLILAACPDESRHGSVRLVMQRLAEEAGVAIHNAQLFGRVRDLSASEERQRLARELHDGLAQVLTHMRLELDFMAKQGPKDSSIRKEIERLVRVVERASGDVRSLIGGLRSPIPPGERLGAALQSYLADVRSLGGPELRFDASGDGALPPDVEAECFRIVQEAVSNAMRHSGADIVRVSLTLDSVGCRLVVADDGAGVHTGNGSKDGSGDRGGVGLGAMAERARKIGATLTIEPHPGEGTTVTLVVPADRRMERVR